MEQRLPQTPSGAEKRRYYRLRYGDQNGMQAFAPELRILNDPHLYRALEISERGFRFKPWSIQSFFIGQRIEARLIFSDGEIAPVSGRVLRFDSGEVIVELTLGIPGQRMMAEQRLELSCRNR